MSMVSELMREAPAYKKAVLAVAVTAGVGACAYLGYRHWSGPQTSDKPRGPSKSEEKSTSSKRVQEPSSEKEGHSLVKPEPSKVEPPSKKEVPSVVKPEPSKIELPSKKEVPSVVKPEPSKVEPSSKKEVPSVVKPEPSKVEPPSKKEVPSVVKPEPSKVEPSNTGASDRSVLTGSKNVQRGAAPHKAEDLSTSHTFEKIFPGPESDNFEHVSLPQITPVGGSPVRKVEKKGQVEEQVVSSGSFIQLQAEPSREASLLKSQDNLSMSQADPSISFLSTAEEELKEEEERKRASKQTKQAVVPKTEGAVGSSNDDQLASAASGVRVKDENDIVVVETHEEGSGLGKSEGEKVSPRSGMASIDVDFDPSRFSPVFGQQTYHRVDTEPEELATFDPARSHPASFGFKFDSNI